MNQKEFRAHLAERFPRERQYLLPALYCVDREMGHLPEAALQAIARHLRLPISEVYGAATSYPEVRLQPGPSHAVRVCTGLSCQLNGARGVLEALRRELDGGAEPDKSGTAVDEMPCPGMCAVAPVLEIDGRMHGRVDSVKALAMVADLGEPG